MPHTGSPRIPVEQLLDADGPVLVASVDELLLSVGDWLLVLFDGVASLCDVELEDEEWLRLCVEEWWEVGALDAELLVPESLVPTGVVGTGVGDAEFPEDV